MTTETKTLAPFDVEGWIKGANLPTESATVYNRADVVSDITALKHRIDVVRSTDSSERSPSEKSELKALEAEYVRLLTVFSESAAAVHVRALTKQELRDLRDAHEKAIENKEMTNKESNASFGYDLLSVAIVAVEPVGQEKHPVSLNPAQVRALEEGIGAAQMQAILEARQTAQNKMPVVDADFLLRPYGVAPGQA
jgi:DNA uptake protein ComE-like DNA-binding protein